MKKYKWEIFLAFFFSLFTIFGYSYKNIDSWDLVFQSPFKNIILFLLYGVIYCLIIFLIEKAFYKIGMNNKKDSKIFDHHPFVVPMVIILIFWLPWIIIKYPGTPGWDFYWMLNYFHGLDGGLTQHFPLFYEFMCGYVIEFGKWIGNVNIGLYLLSLIHGLSMLISFSLVFVYFKKWNVHYKFRIFALLFFALNPIFCNYAVTIYHDVLYSSFFLIYILLLTDIVMFKGLSKKKLIILSIMALGICLTRKNGIYIVLPTELVILWKYKFIRPKTLLLLPIILFYLSEYIFSFYFYKTSILEAITIPIQSVARYSRDYHDDISYEEIMSINRVLNYEAAGVLYNPTLVDDVRNNTGNYDLVNEDLKAFFTTWIKLFFRHPDAYIESFINTTYQLYYPFEKTTYIFLYLMSNKDLHCIVFDEVDSLKPAQDFLRMIIENYEKVPILKYIDDPGFYTWLFLLLIVIVLKNKKEVLPMLPLIMTFLCCLAGPAIDYHGRYAFPIIFSIFPLFAFYSKLYLKE